MNDDERACETCGALKAQMADRCLRACACEGRRGGPKIEEPTTEEKGAEENPIEAKRAAVRRRP